MSVCQAFDSVFMVMLMFFQTLMAGDSWGDCAVPMIQKNPLSIIIFGGDLTFDFGDYRGLDASHELASTYCIMFSFRKPENYVKLSWPVGSLLTVQLGFANLVLAVIVRGQVLFQQS